jgi:hypothetical protein
MQRSLLLIGFAIWIAATVTLRLAGQYVLRPGPLLTTVLLFVVSFGLMAWLARRLCRRAKLPPERWPAGAISLAMPTLLLEPVLQRLLPCAVSQSRP